MRPNFQTATVCRTTVTQALVQCSSTMARLLVVLAIGMVATAAANSLTVDTTFGPVTGQNDPGSLAAQYWLGIPFGATTGGANRFMPPQPPSPWTTPFVASEYGPGCVQTGHNADVPKRQSEDCLSLNVYAPSWVNSTSQLPVMLFFYGGAFVEGDSRGPLGMYNSSYIVGTKDVVIVTANYRLGPFGWIVTDKLGGNQGFQDQLLAMHWVQDNIANFGGDKARVTLWGESAGAMSGGLHLVSPASKGLFSQLIMESNPSGFRYRNTEDNAIYGNHVCSLLKCMSGSVCNTTCMQAADTKDVEDAWSKTGGDVVIIAEANWHHILDAFLMCTPTIDGVLIPQNPMVALPAGNFTKGVPILLGTNQNEGSTFVYAALEKALNPILFDLAMDLLFGKTNAAKILDFYAPIHDSSDARTILSRILTDWCYVYDHVLSDPTLFPKFGLPAICENRTCHGSELPMVFHFTTVTSPVANFTMTPVEQDLSQAFVDYWTSFAIHGDPNTGASSQVNWEQFTVSGRENIVLADTRVNQNGVALCADFWDAIGYDY